MTVWVLSYAVIALAFLTVFVRNEYVDADKPTSEAIGRSFICALFWPATIPLGIALVLGEYLGRAARRKKLAPTPPLTAEEKK